MVAEVETIVGRNLRARKPGLDYTAPVIDLVTFMTLDVSMDRNAMSPLLHAFEQSENRAIFLQSSHDSFRSTDIETLN